ncbi:MAG: hypothetical protein ACRDA3_09680 [Peptostreptococcaceae bacterium]
MNFELLENIEQFDQIKKGDMILVKWSDYYIKHTKATKPIMFYEIQKILGNEVICQSRNNHYFNYDMYLEKNSVALEVYKVSIK